MSWRQATDFLVALGIFISGNIESTWENDGEYLDVNEVAGTPGFVINYNFADVPLAMVDATATIHLEWKYMYNGNPAHNVILQVWNHVDNSWDAVTGAGNDFPDNDPNYDQVFFNIGPGQNLTDLTDYVDDQGQMHWRQVHTSNGTALHDIRCEKLRLDFDEMASSSSLSSSSSSSSRSSSSSSSSSISSSSSSSSTSSSSSSSSSFSCAPDDETYSVDLIQYIFDRSQISFASIDTAGLDCEIESFLYTPDNGYMQEEVTEYDDDSTGYITYMADTTSPTTTVAEWKPDNLEELLNQSHVQNGQIAISDHNSPNYPLIDFRSKLFDFDTDTSIDYLVAVDTTGDLYLQYELPTARKVDGMYVQPGVNGVDSTTGDALILCYVGFSNDGVTWTYIAGDPTAPTIYADQQDAIDNYMDLSIASADIAPQVVADVMFTDTSIEAKYWRLYFVPIAYDYTVSISHLRFEQIREHGETLISQTVELVKTTGSYTAGLANENSGTSGAGWFTTLEYTFEFTGQKEATINTLARVTTDSDTEFRIRIKNGGGAWQVRDTVDVDTDTVTLIDSIMLQNALTDLSATWTVLVDLQDQAPVGSPNIEYRLVSSSGFRSTEETF